MPSPWGGCLQGNSDRTGDPRCERSETEFTSENTTDTKDVRSARWIRSHVISRCFTRHSLDSWRLARCRSEEVAMNDLPSLNERTTWLQKPRGGFSTHCVKRISLLIPSSKSFNSQKSGVWIQSSQRVERVARCVCPERMHGDSFVS